ncbi:MAG: hypothetical protein JW741_22315 [Sedimentisphaerales bacterium]|nr:hypothetical protein [Sedimentisphaerales bacterium]
MQDNSRPITVVLLRGNDMVWSKVDSVQDRQKHTGGFAWGRIGAML